MKRWILRALCRLRGGHKPSRLRWSRDQYIVRILPGKVCERCGTPMRR